MSARTPDFAETMRHGGEFALRHVGSFAINSDPVHDTLFRIAKRLDVLGIPYAICGGMAMALHGYVRATVNVDLLVTADGLRQAHEHLEGRGYLPPFAASKHLKDTETGVRIEFLVAGGFPGDGLPKSVVFPDPAAPGVSVERDGVKVLSLATLVELKLASGMTAGHRLKDLADVQQMTETLTLPAEFSETLNPYVRAKYLELWHSLHGPRPEWDEPNHP